MSDHFRLRDYDGDDIAPILALPGVRPASEAPTDGRYVIVIVDAGSPAEWGTPFDTARYGVTIGFNCADYTLEPAEDCWNTVGWCWAHDHHTEGSPRVVAYLPDAQLQDLHTGCGLLG